MISDLLEMGTPRLVLITPPPTRQTRQPERRYLYRTAMISVAKEMDVFVLDTWSLFLNKTQGLASYETMDSISMRDYDDAIMKAYLIDEEHYNSAGNQRHWLGLSNLIKAQYPEVWPWDQCL